MKEDLLVELLEWKEVIGNSSDNEDLYINFERFIDDNFSQKEIDIASEEL